MSKTPIPTSRTKHLKNLNLSDLERLKLSIPPGSLPAGIVIVAVMTESAVQLGYMEANQVPALMPLNDLTRLNGIERIVKSAETVDNRSRQGNIVKIVASRVAQTDKPNFGPAAPKVIAETIGLSKVLQENLERLERNSSRADFSISAKNYLIQQSAKVGEVLEDFIKHQTTSGGSKKTLREIAEEKNLPFWVLSHMTTKSWVPDSPLESIAGIMFPKNISKGIALRVNEWNKDSIVVPLEAFMRKSGIIKQIIQGIDVILGSSSKERGERVERSLQMTYVPIVPPWSLLENVRAKRTSNPVTNREGDLAPLAAVVGRLFQTLVGIRPRTLTAKTFWQFAASFSPDSSSPEKASDQWIASVKDESIDKAPLDLLLLTREVSKKQAKQLLFSIASGIDHEDTRLGIFKDLKETELVAVTNRQVEVGVTPNRNLLAFFGKCTVKTVEDRARRAIQLDLTEEEKKLIASDAWQIKQSTAKERRFPIGDAPTQSAIQLLAAIRPHPTDPLADRHFSGLYPILSELLSSFNSPRVTDRAVQIIRAVMVRIKGEGLFFSTDALTGVGGELVTMQSDQQLFGDDF